MITPHFRLAVHQFDPRPGAPAENAARIADAAADSGSHLMVTPELGLTGYDVRDDVARVGLTLTRGDPFPVERFRDGPDLLVGLVEDGGTGVAYNAAAYVRDGRLLFRHRKVYLPTYGMFDEGRYFGRGTRISAHELGGGWRVGVLVCEDLWHPALSYLLALQQVQLVLVAAAAPGRGVWQGGEAGGRFASWDAWDRIARATAHLYGVYVALGNRIGAEGGVSFAGGSCIIDPTGERLAAAPDAKEAVVTAELSLAAVAEARRPFSHARDDDPYWTLRELDRILEEERPG